MQLKEDRLRVDLEMAEHKLAVAKGEFISREAVVIEWRRAVIAVKNRFLGLGRELAPHLTNKGPQEIKAIIDRRIPVTIDELLGSAHTLLGEIQP